MLTEWAGWEWVLFVNVPIGLAAVALAPRLLPESRDVGAARTFDATGAVLVTGGLAILVYTLVDAESAGWTSTQTLGLGALSLATLAAFVAWESRVSDPLMPFSIFRLRTLRGANAVGVLLGMALFSMFFFQSLYMQQVLGFSALETGFAFLPLAVVIIICSTIASQLVTRTGARPTLLVGMLLITAALVWFSQVSAGGSYVGDFLFPSLVVAVGLGFAFVPVTIAAVTGTRPDEAGLASGLINTSQQIGGALGLAILVSVATSQTANAVADGIGDRAVALNEGFQTAFLVGAGFALLGAIVAALTISSRDCRKQLEGGVEVPVPCFGQPHEEAEVATAPAGAQTTAATTSNLGGVERG
jgi:MFS family permease